MVWVIVAIFPVGISLDPYLRQAQGIALATFDQKL